MRRPDAAARALLVVTFELASCVGRAMAQTPTSAAARAGDSPETAHDPKQASRAGEHFEAGYRLAQQGDYEGAAREFESAHHIDPNPAVLFNLGQAYAASGQPVAAYDALAEYLRQPLLDATRERAARQALSIVEGRTGRLSVEVTPEGADIEIDGLLVGNAPLKEAVRLRTGPHAVVVRASNLQTEAQRVNIASGEEARLVIQLEPPPRPPTPGYVTIHCAIPDVEVWANDERRGVTPLAGPMALDPGTRTIRLERPGYVPQATVVHVAAGAVQPVPCQGNIEAHLAPNLAAKLVIDWKEPLRAGVAAGLYVDGQPFAGSTALLPSGRHQIELRARDYEPWIRNANLTAGTTLRMVPNLLPTPAYVKESVEQAARERLWGGIAFGAGLAFVGTSVTLEAVAASKHAAWAKERDALNAEDLGNTGVAAQLRHNDREALTIQRLSDAALATGIVGVGALVTGVFLWLDAGPSARLQAQARNDGGEIRYARRF